MAVGNQHPWDLFEALKDESHLYIDKGLKLEQANCSGKALVMYEKGLERLDKALGVQIELPGSMQQSLARLRGIRIKMVRTRQQIVFRMRELDKSCSAEKSPNPEATPPSYEEATRKKSDLPSDAEILFSVASGVKVYYIGVSGRVGVQEESCDLHVYRFKEEDAAAVSPALLQAGSWVYPLVPGKSPVLKSTEESYMFPDLDDSIAGNAVGIILPASVSNAEKEVFEALLQHFTDAREEDLSEYDEYIQYSNQVAQGLTTGATLVGRGLIKASLIGGELIQVGTEKLKNAVAPAAENVEVDQRLKAGLETAQWASGKAVTVSGYLVSKAGAATVALGRFLAPHLQSCSAKAISHVAEQSQERSKKQMAVASELASGSIEAISTVYLALENSSKILAKNVAESTVEVVKHRYGSDAGSVTGDALYTAGNTYLAVYNASVLGPKGLAKRVAKDTSKLAAGVPENVVRGHIDVHPPNPGPANDAPLPTTEGTLTTNL